MKQTLKEQKGAGGGVGTHHTKPFRDAKGRGFNFVLDVTQASQMVTGSKSICYSGNRLQEGRSSPFLPLAYIGISDFLVLSPMPHL